MQCDVCRKSCKDAMGLKDEYATLHASFGYGSLKDLQDHECRICEDCYDKIAAFITQLGGQIRIMKAQIAWGKKVDLRTILSPLTLEGDDDED